MNYLFYIIMCVAIFNSGCSIFGTNKGSVQYASETESPLLKLPKEQQDIDFKNNYNIPKITSDVSKLYFNNPPRPNSQLHFTSKEGVEYTWNRDGYNSWLEITKSTAAVTKEITNFLTHSQMQVNNIDNKHGYIETKLENFHYEGGNTKGLVSRLKEKGLKLRVKDDLNYEGKYIISLQSVGNNQNTTKLIIKHEAKKIGNKNTKFVELPNVSNEMSNKLLKDFWIYLGDSK